MAKELELIAKMNREAGGGGDADKAANPVPQRGYERPRALPHKHKDTRGVINALHFPAGPTPTAFREKLAAP